MARSGSHSTLTTRFLRSPYRNPLTTCLVTWPRSKPLRSETLRSAATCLNDCIRSIACYALLDLRLESSTVAFAELETRAAFGAWRRFAVVVASLLVRRLLSLPAPSLRISHRYRLKPAKGKAVRRLLRSERKSRLVFATSAARVKADAHRIWQHVREASRSRHGPNECRVRYGPTT
jgi:hypothetical protein